MALRLGSVLAVILEGGGLATSKGVAQPEADTDPAAEGLRLERADLLVDFFPFLSFLVS